MSRPPPGLQWPASDLTAEPRPEQQPQRHERHGDTEGSLITPVAVDQDAGEPDIGPSAARLEEAHCAADTPGGPQPGMVHDQPRFRWKRSTNTPANGAMTATVAQLISSRNWGCQRLQPNASSSFSSYADGAVVVRP